MLQDSTIQNALIEDGATVVLRYGSSVTSETQPNDIDLYALFDILLRL